MYVGYLPTVGGKVNSLYTEKEMNTERNVKRKKREKQTDCHESLFKTSHLVPPVCF